MSAASPSIGDQVANVAVEKAIEQTDSGASFRDTLIGVAAAAGTFYARAKGIPISDADAVLVIGSVFGGATAVRKVVRPVFGAVLRGALARLGSR